MDEATLSAVRAAMMTAKTPGAYDKVYKDECVYSYDTPLSPTGLYVNLSTHHGVGEAHLALDHEKTGNVLYLHQRWVKTPKPADAAAAAAAAVPTKMAIGVEGGFALDEDAAKYDVAKHHSLVVMPTKTFVSLPCDDLPTFVLNAVDGVLRHAGFHDQSEVAAWSEERRESKYARTLTQEPSEGRKISPDKSSWRCVDTGAVENLWLNLGDGHIGSGRQHWDGSGGNGSALRHYEDMRAKGKEYPLVVKLGTIAPSGADVYSYAPDEDDMVEDPLLAEHLSHWGIDVMTMEKTEKSMAELQIDLNKGFEFDKITESGADLESVSGPNLVGLANLGNTCYVASVAQVLKTLPAVVDRYVAPAMDLARGAPADVTCDFPAQMSKLCVGLVTDKYASAETVTNAGAHESAVNPRMFKNLVGRGHAEFSTGRQQDAVEFFQHLLEQMTREEHKAKARLGDAPPTASQFEFEVEEKTTCVESGAVRYVTRRDNVLPLDVPVESATNAAAVSEFKERELKRQKTSSEGSGGGGGGGKEKADDEEPVRPVVPFDACVAKIAAPELVDDFYSTALGRKGTASKTTRMKTMPNVLAVQVRRYYVAEDWTAKKLDALVPMPMTMDLESSLRGRGMQPGETPLPDPEGPASAEAAADGKGNGSSATVTTTTTVEPSAEIVAQLVSMGFSENGSKRAAIATNNVSADGAMEWVFAHMEDADFNDPPTAVTSAQSAAATSPASEVGTNPESLMMLTSMGFADAHATAALKRSGGDVERAADWLFSHSDDLDAACAEVMSGGGDDGNGGGNGSSVGVSPPESPVVDGVGRYELFGVVSHLGSNTACGHYVAHVLVDGTWCIFNDRKVAKSANVPLDLGYLYFYLRTA